MVSAPGKWSKWVIKKGATWSTVVTYKAAGVAVNLTGKTAKLILKTSFASDTTQLELTSSAGITLGGSAGTIAIVLTATQTAALKAKTLVFDLQIIEGAVIDTIMTGEIAVEEGA